MPFRILTLLLLLALATPTSARLWDPADLRAVPHAGPDGVTIPALATSVDLTTLASRLREAPARADAAVAPVVVDLPDPAGRPVAFRWRASGTLSPAVQARRPDLRTYQGVAVDDPTLRARLTVAASGMHARVLGRDGWTVDSLENERPDRVHLWRHADEPRVPAACDVAGTAESIPAAAKAMSTGDELRVYDLAMTGTGEFAVYHGSIANAEVVIATLVNNANATWERDLSLSMQIVDFNIYPDPATDPFPTGQVMDGSLIQQNHSALINKLGANGFEIGHVVGERALGGWRGQAGVGVQCNAFSQGVGGTLAGTPTANALLEGILHEVGHQLGAFHSFNGTAGDCGPNRTGSWAYEIASGVSIMSYAGTCASGDVENIRLGFYNAGSLQSILDEVASKPSCGAVVLTSNTAPVADAGPDHTIPRQTAFLLDGTATDNEGDLLTFGWEQYDLGPAGGASSSTVNGPTFRNFLPDPPSSRSFPLYLNYRLGGNTPFEYLPSVDRTLTFRMIVRDNNAEAGGIDWDTKVLTVSGDPFVVTSPDGGESLPSGVATPVTWDVGGGSVASDVRILFSDDRGASWTEVVASTPNDGSESVVLPCGETTQARVRIEPLDNVFFDLSDADFTLTADATPPDITCPAPFTVTATSPAGIDATDPALAAWMATASATDTCDGALSPGYAGAATIPVGVNTVAFTVFDTSGNLAFCTTELTVEDPATAAPGPPGRTALRGAHPNPFNPRTTLRFHLARAQSMRLEILDLRGRRVATLREGTLPAGEHAVVWDGGNEASGVYVVRLVTADGEFHRRLALLK